MKVLIEEQYYDQDYLEKSFESCDLNAYVRGVTDKNRRIKFSSIGYCYLKEINDCLFIIPKIIVNEENRAFGFYPPEMIINIWDNNWASKLEDLQIEGSIIERFKSERYFIINFLSQLSVWIYRTISTYKLLNETQNIVDDSICYSESIKKGNNYLTLLDTILSLISFNNRNREILLRIINNSVNGNKINWKQTISHKIPFMINSIPIYIQSVTRNKQLNKKDELITIYYSILSYIDKQYGFKTRVDLNYETINIREFEYSYLKGKGTRELKRIKYKYYSDTLLKIWHLCYDFFSSIETVNYSNKGTNCLLCSDFDKVFENIVDTLIGDQKGDYPSELKEQKADRKYIDTIYKGDSLVNKQQPVYYIVDSKYYSIGSTFSDNSNSVAKQYTYAKNVIHLNIKHQGEDNYFEYRDKLTEGYTITPNFFLSAIVEDGENKLLEFDKFFLKPSTDKVKEESQFSNRLFDRDTLMISHYDINFLYIISLYSRNSNTQIGKFKKYVRDVFRESLLRAINERYEFYILSSDDCENQTKELFYLLNGKIISTEDSNLILALRKGEEYTSENQNLLSKIRNRFGVDGPHEL